MRFARAIWKLLVGVKDALVLIFMLMFFGLLYAGLSAKPTPVGDGILAFDLDGPRVPRLNLLAFPGEEPPQIECNEDAGGDEDDE